jgi:T5SS/PEP-CTERM-associated repeat protein
VSIGELSGAVGTMTVTGNGSLANLSDKLEVGVIGTGALEVLSGGTVSAATAVIARDLGSSGMATVSGAGSMLVVGGDLSVGKGGTASLQITGGGHVTNTTARVGFAAGSQGTVTVDGAGSLWQNTDGIELGSEVGTGTLGVAGGGHVESTYATIGELAGAHGMATVSGVESAVTLSDKLEVGVIGSGELHVLAGGAVSAATAVVARDAGSTGAVEVTGAASALSTTGAMYVGGSAVANGGTAALDVTASGNVTTGTLLKVWQGGSITVNGGTLNYPALEMAGGSLTQGTIDLTGKTATGFGTLNGIVTGSGTVTASGGTLTLGDPASTAGVSLTGTLAVGANTHAILLDADRVDLGMTTTLAAGAQITAVNGLSLAAGRTFAAAGNATVGNAFTNGGIVNGPVAAGELLTFAGDVDGPGSFTGNIQFAGQLTPGTSLAPVSINGNATFASTATLRLLVSGAIAIPPGSMIVAGNATLGGSLDVDLFSGIHPALGSSFTVMTFGSRTGDFANYADTALGGHLALKPQFTPNSLVLKALPAVSGDINLDGTVNIFDINSVSANWGTAGPQGDANGDGIVNIFDINLISSNWGATGVTAVPEPAGLTIAALATLCGVAAFRRQLRC